MAIPLFGDASAFLLFFVKEIIIMTLEKWQKELLDSIDGFSADSLMDMYEHQWEYLTEEDDDVRANKVLSIFRMIDGFSTSNLAKKL